MRGLVWLDSAVNDLVRLRDFIRRENPNAASRVASIIKETTQNLIHFPEIGKPVAELLDYRDLFIRFGAGGYIVRYRIQDEVIYMVHLRHYREERI